MSRGADVRSIDKIVTLADGRRLEGAEIRSKNVQRLNRSSAILRGSKLKFFYSRKLRIGIPAFVMGFLACGWLNIVNKPPPVVVKKVVRKKKPKLTIEEIPDEEPEDPSGGGGAEMTARPGEEMKMVLVVNDSLGMSAGKACSSPLNENLVMCLFFRKPHSHKNIVSYAHRFFFFFSIQGASRRRRTRSRARTGSVRRRRRPFPAGKIAAQCCHATLAVYQSLEGKHANVLRKWEAEGQKKIALKCDGDAQLAGLVAAAKSARLPHHLVQDAGRTQVAAGSRTVLAIGPAPEMAVNAVTGTLRLL